MMSIYITNTKEYWDGLLADAGAAAAQITAKLDLVRSYMKGTFDIDIDQLRATILRRQEEVTGGKVDLTSLAIN